MTQTATNPQTGEKVALIGGEWKPISQTATNDAGVKAYLVGGEWITDEVSVPLTPTPKKEEGILDQMRKGTITERIKARTILYPEEETAIRKTLQSAASGPLSGIVQAGASMFGFDDVAKKIAQTAKEGNMAGSFLQPEMLLTGGAAGKLIGEGTGLLSKGLRAAGIGGAYGATSAQGDANNQLENRATTAATTAAISFVSPALLQAASKGTGWAIDLLKGRLSEIKAGKVLRDVAGEELPKIQAALAASGNDVTAAQSAAPVGSTRFSALGQRAAEQDSQFTTEMMARQAADREAKIASLAGGQTQTAARQAIQGTKASLTGLTNPMREAELGYANIAGDTERRLVPQITQAEKGISGVNARQAEADFAASQFGGVASDSTGAITAQLSNQKAFVERQIQSLKDSGLTPLNTESITGKIVSSLNDPKLAGSKPIQNVMSNVAKEIEEWTAANGGIIDAQALYSIRKNAVASEVSRLNPSATEKTQAKMTAAILGKVSPLIDDAIEAAGGTGWRNYLQTYADGMGVINRMKLGGEALKMLQKSPAAFMELVKGNNPKAVQKIFSGEYDVARAMGDKFKPLREVSSELERDAKLKELASAGGTDLANILAMDASGFRLPNMLSRPALVANKVLDVAEESLNRKVMAKVYNAMRNGKDASALMNQLSTAEQNLVLQAVSSGRLQPYLNSAVTAGAQQ